MSLADVTGRLSGKVAIVTGAGQTPGETVGNGKATALLFARAGASVLCVDRDLDEPRPPSRTSSPRAAA
jgi:NAD(P)-dependent dehydrogenase (short-subunit alcohol dehydrogenase family)